jgi:hypothetical protein
MRRIVQSGRGTSADPSGVRIVHSGRGRRTPPEYESFTLEEAGGPLRSTNRSVWKRQADPSGVRIVQSRRGRRTPPEYGLAYYPVGSRAPGWFYSVKSRAPPKLTRPDPETAWPTCGKGDQRAVMRGGPRSARRTRSPWARDDSDAEGRRRSGWADTRCVGGVRRVISLT